MEQTPDSNAPAGPSASAEKGQQAPVPLEYAVCSVARRVWASLIDSACLVAMIGVQVVGLVMFAFESEGTPVATGLRSIRVQATLWLLLTSVFGLLYIGAEVTRGATFGKRLLGCHIEADGAVTTCWRLLIRCLLKNAPLVGLWFVGMPASLLLRRMTDPLPVLFVLCVWKAIALVALLPAFGKTGRSLLDGLTGTIVLSIGGRAARGFEVITGQPAEQPLEFRGF